MLYITVCELWSQWGAPRPPRPRTIREASSRGYKRNGGAGGPGPGPYGRLQAGAIRATGGAGGTSPRTIREASSRGYTGNGGRRGGQAQHHTEGAEEEQQQQEQEQGRRRRRKEQKGKTKNHSQRFGKKCLKCFQMT